MRRMILVFLAVTLLAIAGNAQPQTGLYSQGAFDSKILDTVNIGNLNVHFSVPVLSKPGRGLPFSFNLTYNSSIWTPASVSGSLTWTPDANWGWTAETGAHTGYWADKFPTFGSCVDGGHHVVYWIDSGFQYHDAQGTVHSFSGLQVSNHPDCTGVDSYNYEYADDASGYLFIADATSGILAVSVVSPNGTTIKPPSGFLGTASTTDVNGNVISVNSSGQITDTTGNVVLTPSGSAPSPTKYTYTDTSGAPQSVTVNYTPYTVQTAFNCTGTTVHEFGPTNEYLISSISYPDSTSYSFTYEQTPGVSGNVTGRLASVTLPEGGTIQYTYSGGSNGIECSDGGAATLTRTMSSVTGTPATTYTRTPGTNSSHTEVVDGFSNYGEYDFVNDATDPNYTPYLVKRQQYEGNTSGTLLLSAESCLNGAISPCTGQSLSLPITSIKTTTTLNGSETKESALTLNAYGLVTDDKEYDYGTSPTPGSMLSDTQISYASLSNGIINQPSTVQTIVGSVVVSSVSYSYDGNTLTSTSGLPQHNSVTGSRGNLTSVQYSTGGIGSTPITTAQYFYDDAGQLRTSKDAALDSTTYSFDSATDAFLTGTSYPTTGTTTHSTSASWDAVRGVIQNSHDLNGNQTTYTYDLMLRLSTVSTPAGGYQAYTYSLGPSSPYTSVSTLHTIGGTCPSSACITATSYLDSYGRLSKSDTTDTTADDLVAYAYDANGNLNSVSNPYQTGTPLYAVTSFDALGRPTKITDTDSSQQTASYSGNSVTVADEAGKQRELFIDGLGRVNEVLEPDSSGTLSLESDYLYYQNATTGTGSTPTTYQTLVHQKGGSTSSSLWRTRTFTYDMLARTLSEATPEAGTISFSFISGSSFCAGVVTLPCGRTDANGTTTSYSYDALDRLTGKSYGGTSIGTGTTPVTYYYDQTSYNGLTISNGNGLRTGMSDGSGATAWSFDGMGRVAAIEKTINSVTKSAGYTYNADGTTNTVQDFGGTTFTYGYNSADRPVSIVDGSSNSYASSAAYNPAGELTQLTHQLTTGSGLYQRTINYNNRLQPSFIGATLNGSQLQSLTYGYGTGGTNNDNILTIANGMDLTHHRDQSYTYDNMNRVTSGQDSHWGENYTYDNWGNLFQTTPISGLSGNNWSVTANGNNQLSNLTYDSAGEVTKDQYSNSLSYDADGRILTGGSGTYVYDGDGNRVKKTVGGTTTLYWPGTAGTLDESNSSASTFGKQVAFNNLLVWHEDTSGNGLFLFQDHLGTTRITDTAAGSSTPIDDIDYRPFGTMSSNYGSSPSGNHYLFTGYESDPETTTDYAVFRNLGMTLGRFNRADPYNGSYDPNNPQSLNRYSYALNQPLNWLDPLGLTIVCDSVWWTQIDPNTGIYEQVTAVYCLDDGGADAGAGPSPAPAVGPGGGPGGGPAPNKGSFLHRAACGAFSWLTGAASATNSTIGIGAGGNAGVGFILGIAASAGVQVVADSSGNLGVAISAGGNPGYGVFGVGAMGGVQGSVSTASTIYDLRGPAWDFGATAGEGPAVGADVAVAGPDATLNVTVGPGVGTKGAAFAGVYTWVPSALSTKCR